MSRDYIFEHEVVWKRDKIGDLKKENFPTIEIAIPPEFKGHDNIWSPEDLFVASVNSCFMATFLSLAQKFNLEFISYAAKASGELTRSKEEGYQFTKIKIRPVITLMQDSIKQEAQRILDLSEKHCFVAKSIKSKIKVEPKFLIEPL